MPPSPSPSHAASPADAAALGIFISTDESVEDAPPSAPGGPLAGLRFAAKDNIDVLGFPTTAGTRALAGNRPAADAPIVARLRAAGARPVAKANMHELSLGVTSTNAWSGPVRNPADPERIAGGSSGGSAAACAIGAVDFAIGTDTGGSVRLPAAHCGVTGFRPSLGRYPVEGIIGLSWTRDTAGVISADLDRIIAVDAAVTGEEELPEPGTALRLGVPQVAWQGLQETVRVAGERELDRLRAAGHEIVPIDETEFLTHGAELADLLVAWEAPRAIAHYLAEAGSSVTLEEVIAGVASPDVQGFFEFAAGEPVSEERYRELIDSVPEYRSEYAALFARYGIEALLYPTVPYTAPRIGEDPVRVGDLEVPVFRGGVRNLEVSTLVGTPSVSVPIETDGMPTGLTWEALPGHDRLLLSMVRRETGAAGGSHPATAQEE